MIDEEVPKALVDDLTTGLQAALGQDLVALYLYGSAVSGGFDAGSSDLDLLVVVAGDLNAQSVQRLAAFHAQTITRHPDWDDRLELVYVARETLARFRDSGGLGVISPGEAFHLRDGVELWLQNFYLVRESAVTLAGPAPASTIPPISREEFLAATVASAEEVAARNLHDSGPGSIAYSVLTLCRALCTVRTNRPCSKQDGAAWVRSRMPEWAWLIDAAERSRLSRGREGFADAETRRAATTLIGLLAAAIRGDGAPPSLSR